MLNPIQAQAICDKIAGEIGQNVIICAAGGEIIAASARSRIGQVHAIGAKIMAGEIDSYHVSAEQAAASDGMLEGFSVGIDVDGLRLASVGVTGPIEVSKRFAMVASDWAANMISAERARQERDQQVSELARGLQREIGGILTMIAQHMGEAQTALSTGHEAADKTRKAAREASRTAETSQSTSSAAQSQMDALAKQTRAMDQRVHDTSTSVTNADTTSSEALDSVTILSSSTRDISKALDLIKGVAMKTRLLSLNARVEAARAGDAGRGFSVVAQEVGSLSDQTTETTDRIEKDINNLESRTNEVISSLGAIHESMAALSTANAALETEFSDQAGAIRAVADQIREASENNRQSLKAIHSTDTAAEETLQSVESAAAATRETETIVAEAQKRLSDFIEKLNAGAANPRATKHVDLRKAG